MLKNIKMYTLHKTVERMMTPPKFMNTYKEAFQSMLTDFAVYMCISENQARNFIGDYNTALGIIHNRAWVTAGVTAGKESCHWEIFAIVEENGVWTAVSIEDELIDEFEQEFLMDTTMYEPYDYGCYALIEITEDRHCKLVSTLNPDANEPICGETYSNAWSLPVSEAARRFREEGFWNVWSQINGEIAGGIDLIDGLDDDDIDDFMGCPMSKNLCGNSKFVANYIESLEVGTYLIAVCDKQ